MVSAAGLCKERLFADRGGQNITSGRYQLPNWYLWGWPLKTFLLSKLQTVDFICNPFGRSDDLKSIFADADLFCSPSLDEPFGLVISEAWRWVTGYCLHRWTKRTVRHQHGLCWCNPAVWWHDYTCWNTALAAAIGILAERNSPNNRTECSKTFWNKHTDIGWSADRLIGSVALYGAGSHIFDLFHSKDELTSVNFTSEIALYKTGHKRLYQGPPLAADNPPHRSSDEFNYPSWESGRQILPANLRYADQFNHRKTDIPKPIFGPSWSATRARITPSSCSFGCVASGALRTDQPCEQYPQ